jgi:hypothetical protein
MWPPFRRQDAGPLQPDATLLVAILMKRGTTKGGDLNVSLARLVLIGGSSDGVKRVFGSSIFRPIAGVRDDVSSNGPAVLTDAVVAVCHPRS